MTWQLDYHVEEILHNWELNRYEVAAYTEKFGCFLQRLGYGLKLGTPIALTIEQYKEMREVMRHCNFSGTIGSKNIEIY